MAGRGVDIDEDCNEIVAHLPGLRRHMSGRTRSAGAAAKRKLAAHRYQGHAYIETGMGVTDGLVSLVDPDGNAMTIEYGRSAGSPYGPSQGIFALQGIWR